MGALSPSTSMMTSPLRSPIFSAEGFLPLTSREEADPVPGPEPRGMSRARLGHRGDRRPFADVERETQGLWPGIGPEELVGHPSRRLPHREQLPVLHLVAVDAAVSVRSRGVGLL